MYYWLFKWLLFRPFITHAWKPWVEGLDNVPDRGPAILVSNHLSYYDTLVLPASVPPKLIFPAKAELFRQRTLGGRVVAWFLRVIGMLPMDRSGGHASGQSLDHVAQVLADGNILGIYPEGTRSPDGRLYKGKTGVARLVLQHRVPVIPVGTVGTELVRGPFGMRTLRRPGIRVGEPLDFSAYYDRPGDREVLRWVTDEIMAAVQRLTGQEYVDVYATSLKSGALEGRDIEQYVRPRPGAGRAAPPDTAGRADGAPQTSTEPEAR